MKKAKRLCMNVHTKTDVSKTFAHGANTLVGGQDTLARGNDGIGDLAELLLEGGFGVVEVGSHIE